VSTVSSVAGGGHVNSLVGRDAELAQLIAEFRTAESGRMAAVVLGGDAGVGKTRLISELAEHAAGEGAIVLHGHAIDIREAPPFWPMITALRHGMVGSSDQEMIDILGPRLAQLDDLSAGSGPRARALEVLHRVVVELASLRVVVLIIEDLHWADRSTCDLLVYLIANLTSEPVLLVGTWRSDTPGGMPEVIAALAELRRHRQVSWRQVEPLSRQSAARLVEAWAPARPDLQSLVWQRSAGNALIIEETVRAVLGGDASGLPATLREVILARVGALSGGAQQVVRAVAASTGPLPHPLLATVLQEAGPPLLDAVREAAAAGVVVVDERDQGYRLRHGLMTEVVAADLLPGERMELHRRYAIALTDGRGTHSPGIRTGARSPALDARLAHHWQLAGAAEQAFVSSVAAARGSERIRGYAEAHRHWLRAASLTAQVPADGTVPSRSECLERAAEAADLAGDHEDAVALLERRLGEPDAPAGLPGALLTARMGRYLAAAGHEDRAVRTYKMAAGRLPPAGDDAARAEVLAGHASVLLQSGRFAKAGSVAVRALELSRAAGARTVEAKVLAIYGFSQAYLSDVEAGSSALDDALAVAERTAEPSAIGEAYLRQAELLSGPLNALDQGVACARRGVARVSELGLARTAGVTLLTFASNGLFRLGRWDQAEQSVTDAWARAPSGAEALDVRLARCRLRVGRGEFDTAVDDLEAIELLTGPAAGPRYRIPLLILRAGMEMWRSRPDTALACVEEGLDLVEAGQIDLWLVAPLIWHGARAWAEITRLGLPPLSPMQARRLRGHRADLARRGTDTVVAVQEVLATFTTMSAAEIARAEGRSDPAEWAKVAELWEQRQQPYPTAYARLRRAEAILAGRARSTEAAGELRLAARTARSLGAAPFLTEITDLAARARIRLDPAEPGPRPERRAPTVTVLDALTPRELDVLVEMASGLTNREIGRRLFISEKTVGVHVSRIFSKTGVHSRVQASALLHRSADGPRLAEDLR
jgi:DNA-binding CsgD family transcriptional regulator/tetratricopeptide (TPR) repeat protein